MFSVCTAVVRGRTMKQFASDTPVGQAGAATGELDVWPSSTIWADATPGAMRHRALRPAAIASEKRFMFP